MIVYLFSLQQMNQNEMAIRILSYIRYRSNKTLSTSSIWRWRQSLGIITDKLLKEKEAFFRLVLLASYLRENARGIDDFVDSPYAKSSLSYESQVRKEISEAVDFFSRQNQEIYKIEEVFLQWE
jgi:hypothetical protein